MISNTRYWFLVILVILVYIRGMFITLFENDSAQFAVMAMRMIQENDFLNLFKGSEEYLDKPHMHYWLAALSFKIFGIYDWAYRIPSLLATLLGAYSCFGLGRLLYNKVVGKYAALIFMTCQTIFLSVIDVRTDAILTGFTIFSVWQLITYAEKRTLKSIIWGAFGAGMAFSTKGQIAIVVIGLSLLCHLWYTHKWKIIWDWRCLVALFIFAITIAPMLYAYYHQFDLHPEKIIRGKDNRSGIFFIFWEQSFERLSGRGVGKNSSNYFFFFHTFLWVFLPWTVIALFAYWSRAKTFFKMRFRYHQRFEFVTLGGITLVFLLISFAQFKLPHYINIIMPLYALLTASYIHDLYQSKAQKEIKLLLVFQYLILGIVVLFSLGVCFYVFKLQSMWSMILLIVSLLVFLYVCWRPGLIPLFRLTLYAALMINVVMNFHFYPSLIHYQGGSTMAQQLKQNDVASDKIYKINNRHTWALDFYSQHPVKFSPIAQLPAKKGIWIYADDKDIEHLRKANLNWDKQLTVDQFRITRLRIDFLNPSIRPERLSQMYLVHLN